MSVDINILYTELVAAGLPVSGDALLPAGANTSGYTNATFYVRAEGIVKVDWAILPLVGSANDLQAAAIVAAHGGKRKPRSLWDIRADLVLLTLSQKGAIWSDLNSGSPPKWTQDFGPEDGALSAHQLLGASLTLPAADVLESKIRVAMLYVRDNPTYLVNQTFGGTVAAINVPGDAPAP